jgi:hypothetical protein
VPKRATHERTTSRARGPRRALSHAPDGSLTLSDLREPTLTIGCKRCGRHGRYNGLVAAHGADAKLTDLLVTLANCEKARSFSIHD